MSSMLWSPKDQARLAGLFIPKIILMMLCGAIGLPLLPFVLIGSVIYHRPPNMVYASHVWRYLRYTWTAQPSPPGFPPCARVWLTLSILQQWFLAPVLGTAWLLDEILYGKKLDKIIIDRPFFVVSGGRSGSTQITRYIEDDPEIVTPNILMCMFPYLWLWKLVPFTIGRFISPDYVREKISKTLPPEILERHEFDPFRTDTFEAAYLSPHLIVFSMQFGPEIGKIEFSFAEYATHNKYIYEEIFPNFVDRLGKKTMLFYGHENKENRRFFIKGHFLVGAPALARRYPNANFLTLIRDPATRLRSGINFLRHQSADPLLGPVPWEWLAEILPEVESRYCDVEMEWFSEDDENRCVVRFQDFVDDLPSTMKKVYAECFGRDVVPSHVPIEHPPRERKNYSVNKSLDELNVDEEALKIRLADYICWLQQRTKSATS